ncbi:MAG TPA: DUF4435 domain-containing protein [Chloroflexia bacterium]|jgi:hypothetical protein
MSRLTHSFPGLRRAMQMSRTRLFAFVEGKSDRYFYGRICRSICEPAGIAFEVSSADIISGTGGGKTVLLAFFEYLRQRSSLLDNLHGKTTGSIFFLDKDIDDVLRTQRRSDHLVYTRYYDLENHIFVQGNLISAAAAVAGLDEDWLRLRLGDADLWRLKVAEHWKDWVTFCMFSRKRKIRCRYNYGSASCLNVPPQDPPSAVLKAQHLTALEALSGRTSHQFRRSMRAIASLVDYFYARGYHDHVFRGKWYPELIEEELKAIAGTELLDASGIRNRIVFALLMTIDFEGHWAEYFKEPVRRLIGRL